MARYAAKRPQGNGDKGYKLIRKIKAVAYDGRPPILLTHKKALLSISDGRASSFFNTFIKIITSPPFYGSGFSSANIRRKTEKIREFKRKSEKIREKRRKIREKRRI